MWAFKLVFLLLASLSVHCDEEWSWGGTKQKTESENKPKSDTTAEAINPNVIDEIITSGRDGRMLSGFSDIYEDQDVQDAISSGNETHARSLVRDRLCGLGLMAVSILTCILYLRHANMYITLLFIISVRRRNRRKTSVHPTARLNLRSTRPSETSRQTNSSRTFERISKLDRLRPPKTGTIPII